MAGSDPILGMCITPKSLWASEVAPVHEGTGWLTAGLVFAAFFTTAFPRMPFWQILPEVTGSFCHGSEIQRSQHVSTQIS